MDDIFGVAPAAGEGALTGACVEDDAAGAATVAEALASAGVDELLTPLFIVASPAAAPDALLFDDMAKLYYRRAYPTDDHQHLLDRLQPLDNPLAGQCNAYEVQHLLTERAVRDVNASVDGAGVRCREACVGAACFAVGRFKSRTKEITGTRARITISPRLLFSQLQFNALPQPGPDDYITSRACVTSHPD